MNKGGRPTKLTQEIADEIIKLIEAGNYVETAAGCCGIQKSTLYRWLRRGARAKSGLHRLFCDAVKKADGRAEAAGVVRIRQAGKQAWQADAWFLERRFRDRWGKNVIIESQEPRRTKAVFDFDDIEQLPESAEDDDAG